MRGRPEPITGMTRVEIPDTIKDLHLTINLSADYFFIQRIAFLHTMSRGYNFRTMECTKDFWKKYDKSKILKGVCR